jgi:MFS family permease
MDEQRNITIMENFFLQAGRFGKNYFARLKLFSRNIRFFLLGQFIIGLGLTCWRLLFNLYLRERGFPDEQIGDTLAVVNISTAIAALPAGYIAGRYSLKILLIIATLFSPLMLAGAICSSEQILLYAFVFLGFGSGIFIFIVGGPFIMRNSTEVERTYIFSANFIIMLLGGIIGNVFSGNLREAFQSAGIDAVSGYRYVILGGLAFSMLGVIPFLMIKEKETHEPGEDKLRLEEFRKWNWALFGKALAPSLLVAIGAGLMVQFMNLYFRDRFESGDDRIGYFLSAQAATMAVGVMLAPVIAEKLGKVNTIVGTQLLSLPFMVLLALTHNVYFAVFALVVRASLMNMSHPVSSALVLGLCKKKEQGILNALLTMSWTASWAVSAVGFGRIFKGDYTKSFLAAVVLYFLSCLLYYVFFRNADRILAKKNEEEQPVE